MKKASLFTMVILLIVVMGLSGCGGGNKEKTSNNQPAKTNESKGSTDTATKSEPKKSSSGPLWMRTKNSMRVWRTAGMKVIRMNRLL